MSRIGVGYGMGGLGVSTNVPAVAAVLGGRKLTSYGVVNPIVRVGCVGLRVAAPATFLKQGSFVSTIRGRMTLNVTIVTKPII